ncbi:MAG: hypothetical protein O7C75_01640 [Verrucomicrobia bacterium]|nr:hypothetical protein [Verrucomicrobiota bacterium]
MRNSIITGLASFKDVTFTAVFLILGFGFIAQSEITQNDHMVAMDDGVRLNTTVFVPDGEIPKSGWPAVIFVHGLGSGKYLSAAKPFAKFDYITLAYTVRGGGQQKVSERSEGVSTMAGPREVEDLKGIISWLKKSYPVNPKAVGITGPSLGGIHSWMAVAHDMGVAASVPQNFPVSSNYAMLPGGNIHPRFVGIPRSKSTPLTPELSQLIKHLTINYDTQGVIDFMMERGEFAQQIEGEKTPILALVAWEDHWGSNSAIEAIAKLKGPRKLYLGTGGHGSSTVPSEIKFRNNLIRSWFDRYLKGERNRIDKEPVVEIALLDTWEHMQFAIFPPREVHKKVSYPKGPTPGELANEPAATNSYHLIHLPKGKVGLADLAEGRISLRPEGLLKEIPLSSVSWKMTPEKNSRLVIGIPKCRLELSSKYPRFQVAVRLWDVDPSAKTRRLFSRAAQLVEVSNSMKPQIIEFDLAAIGYRIQAGNHIELEISNLDMDWDKTKNTWYRVRSIPLFQKTQFQVHAGSDTWIQIPFLEDHN